MRTTINTLLIMLYLLILAASLITGCSLGERIRTDIIKPAFQEEIKFINLVDEMADAYWDKRDLKAGFATGKASINPPSLQTQKAIDQLNTLATKDSDDYKKGLGLGYWINYLWYDARDTINNLTAPGR